MKFNDIEIGDKFVLRDSAENSLRIICGLDLFLKINDYIAFNLNTKMSTYIFSSTEVIIVNF